VIQLYVYILFQIIFHYRLLQDIDSTSMFFLFFDKDTSHEIYFVAIMKNSMETPKQIKGKNYYMIQQSLFCVYI